MQRIAIIDYGMGNLHSAAKALEHVAPNDEVIVTSDAVMIGAADRVVLPGVGAIRDCVGEMRQQGVDKIVSQLVEQGTPLLGICVGMQAMLQHSQENGGVDALGIFNGEIQRLKGGLDESGNPLKIPHMGWNQVAQAEHPIWHNIDNHSRFYFVHSFAAQPNLPISIGHCTYGETFTAAIAHKNIVATQFHPEKSHTAGLQLLANFVTWQPEA
ncbi:imidazole glycerol phosphate synthase subunit HisH [Salinibius halmophilus]|uniref:imidazole glycerol phosphate synthase subunit HisH n=1 Tax=Salinibius halmophilus TaxID=1853216 RepID=UPI000E661BE5|nr:imidazole glycerol phosphate synthase subunit HisH [Salinibius halmophilus]